MKILILGSEGFIGRHLVNFYVAKGQSVYGADLMEVGTQRYNYFKISRLSPEFDELLQANAFDACINAAGSGNVPYSMTHPVSDFESNSLDVIKLLDGIRRFRPECKFLHISSAAVYGNPVSLPISEESALQPLSAYGWHKLISENICHEYASVYKLKTAITRPFSVYGPGLKKQLLWDIYQKVLNTPVGGEVELWGTGNESRDFIYIDDLVKCFDLILQKGQMSGDIYNVATGTEVTIGEIADVFINSWSKGQMIRFNQNTRKGDPLNWRADVTKLRQLGFKPTVEIKKGLANTISWLKEKA